MKFAVYLVRRFLNNRPESSRTPLLTFSANYGVNLSERFATGNGFVIGEKGTFNHGIGYL